jgi:hypothetical protein
VLALCWEIWLDYLAFLLLACGLAYFLNRKRQTGCSDQARIRFVLRTSIIVGVLYLAVKVPYSGEHLNSGHESDTVFTYRYPTMAVEDVISNVFTYPYLAVSNYLPSFLVSSNSLYHHGPDKLIQQQVGYHEAKAQLVPMHHLFLWHFYAGATLVCLAWYGVRALRRAWTNPSESSLVVAALVCLIATGFLTHTIIKFRPYLSVPLLSYKCIGSVTGVALLLSFFTSEVAQRFQGATRKVLFVTCAWLLLMGIAMERCRFQNHLSRQVGLGAFPDPVREIVKWARHRTS